MRKLVTVRKIADILPIPDADAIEVAVVDGWKIVVKKNEYSVGDVVVYAECDSWVPHHLAPFLSKGQEPREYEGIKGERLRTVKLRGQISQGLILPMSVLPVNVEYTVGDDVTDVLGVVKYDPPVPAQISGEVRGHFPTAMPKSSQERCQNLVTEIEEWKNGTTFEVSEKLDGTSCSMYVNGDDYGICSRNYNLKENYDNTLWKMAKKYDVFAKIASTKRNLMIQGEVCGEGIQKNRYAIKGHDFFVYNIFDIDKQEWLSPNERMKLLEEFEMKSVPIISVDFDVKDHTVESLLAMAEAKSVLNVKAEREGLVFKGNDLNVSFKAISNKFLLKNGE